MAAGCGLGTDERGGVAACRAFSREEVLRRIEALAVEFLSCLTNGDLLDMEALKRDASAMEFDHENQRQVHSNKKRLVKLNRQGGRRYAGIWLILQTVHTLLTEQKTATQRDVYYLHLFFKVQSEADEAILDAGSILGVPRGFMNIVGATKGCFTGELSILRNGTWRYYGGDEETSITQELLQLKPSELQSDAKYILVIEKDGIFNRLREDRFFELVPSILVTGRGFPDLATRAFVSLLSHALKIPVLGLCDCNPFGLSIMLTYKLGSARMPLETLRYTVDLKWIGVRPSQIARLGLPKSTFKTLTQKDISVANSLARTPFVQTHKQHMNEVLMWQEGALPWKIELEALHFLGFSFLTSFLEQCILGGDYF